VGGPPHPHSPLKFPFFLWGTHPQKRTNQTQKDEDQKVSPPKRFRQNPPKTTKSKNKRNRLPIRGVLKATKLNREPPLK